MRRSTTEGETDGGRRDERVLTARMNFSDRGHLDPKLLVCRVMFSLVCESKDGFSISALTNTQMWFFTWRRRDRQMDRFAPAPKCSKVKS